MMTTYHCSDCKRPYPEEFVFRCSFCGGTFDIADGITYDPSTVEEALPGIWRYRHTFGLPRHAPILTLGEGNTSLVWANVANREIAFKLEYQNPTGSFKDRLTAPEVSFLLALGVEEAVEDSSGNAGASFAAYAGRAGIKGRVFVPAYASGPKREQISAYGAEVVSVEGPRSAAAEAVVNAVNSDRAIYASHAYLPHGIPGLATIAYELFEQLGQAPGSVIVPAGHGSLLLGITQGFLALQKAGRIQNIPTLVGVQAKACAPLWALCEKGDSELATVSEGETIAEGVRSSNPVRGDALLRMSQSLDLSFVIVEEADILSGRDQLARLGFYVEPTSAIVWNAMEQVLRHVPAPIVTVLTGSGLKAYHP
jgi:threonine synthase